NVWGQGKLDAFAAVDQSPRGDSGQLAGTVTDAVSGDPIGGATVSMTCPVDRQRTTDPDGGYQITLPVGEYQVTASAFGYTDSTAQAEILAGQTTVQDFALQPVDSVTISGTVTDGSAHGWPLYARIQVTGTPVQTFTDPATGQYSLTLPAGDTFDLVFSAEYPGYADTTVTVDTSGSDQTVDVTLTVELNRCREAPGYELQQPRMAMVTSDPGSQFRNYFAERGIAVDFFTATQIAGITGYDLVLWGYNATSVTEANFLQFLANTDADG